VRHLDSTHQAGIPSRELVGPLVGQFLAVDEYHDALAEAVVLSQRSEEYSLAQPSRKHGQLPVAATVERGLRAAETVKLVWSEIHRRNVSCSVHVAQCATA
jgi:hypothetical protein